MNIALIFGCARSGTSIVGELIASHPDVRYIFEAHEIWEMGGSGVNESHRLMEEHATPAVIQKIRDWFETQQGSSRFLVEKNPRNVLRIPYITAIFPEAALIHIVRDGRDVACSMIPGIGNKEWSHLKPPSWQKLMQNYEGAVRCAYAWKEIIEIALKDLVSVPHLCIRFEDFVRNPVQIAQTVLQYLRLTEHPAVFDFCSRVSNTTQGSYHAQVQAMWYRNNHKFRVDRWKENLTSQEQELIHTILQDPLHRLGYL